jgi:hypothetical protein
LLSAGAPLQPSAARWEVICSISVTEEGEGEGEGEGEHNVTSAPEYRRRPT